MELRGEYELISTLPVGSDFYFIFCLKNTLQDREKMEKSKSYLVRAGDSRVGTIWHLSSGRWGATGTLLCRQLKIQTYRERYYVWMEFSYPDWNI